jgi:cyclic beta-1,2-glucan synthetase
MAQQLQDHRTPANARYFEWLDRVAPHLAEIQTRVPAAQAADNLSVSNAITSLRSISDADWPEIVAATSVLTRLMLGSPAFAAERDDTRDQTLHAVELLARKSGQSEREVATTLLGLMRGAESSPESGDVDARTVANYWLRGAGRGELRRALGLADDRSLARHRRLQRAALPAYLSAIGVLTAALVAWMLVRHSPVFAPGHATPWLAALAALLMIFPASEAVVAIVNRLISESTRPVRLPRSASSAASRRAPDDGRDPGDADLARERPRARPRPRAALPRQPRAPRAVRARHRLARQRRQDRRRRRRLARRGDRRGRAPQCALPAPADEPARFIVLHRERRLSPTEERWIGWERKRGKLEQLIALLAEGGASPFFDLGRTSTVAAGTRYIVTLDSDTRLPPGRLRELVGVAAHPHNLPQLSADGKRVERGYAILQPHVATPLPEPDKVTLYHWLFAGQPGIDPYSAASSEVYQDVFGEGTYAGKGLLHVQAMHAVLGGRLPENRILSHDLLEGSVARCAAVTDITVIEDAPFHADVAASRVHRWTRGDWQLLPFLCMPALAPARDQPLEDARQPAPFAGRAGLARAARVRPRHRRRVAVGVVRARRVRVLGRPAHGRARRPVAEPRRHRPPPFLSPGVRRPRPRAGERGLAARATAPARADVDRRDRARALSPVRQQAPSARMADGRRGRGGGDDRPARPRPQALGRAGRRRRAVARADGGRARPTPSATLLCIVWAMSPLWTWWVSRPRPVQRGGALSLDDRALLHDVARDTWRLFERVVGAEDNHLPPDNLQVVPSDMVAHRTSPTNIGLYLLATACAQRFGWIGTVEMIERVEATLATLAEAAAPSRPLPQLVRLALGRGA